MSAAAEHTPTTDNPSQKMNAIKHLPIADLEVVGVIYCIGEDDEGRADFDFEIQNEALRAQAKFSDEASPTKCDCCGQRLKYACEVVHKPTLAGYYVGRSCASKIQTLGRYAGSIENASVAMAERAKCNANEKAFRVARPDAVVALDWAKSEQASRLAADFVAKLRRWGSLSEGQVACLLRMHEDFSAKLALAATGVRCPEGRLVLHGTITSLKNSPEPARYGGQIDHWKMVIALGNGVKVWGTCPEAISPKESYRPGPSENEANEAGVGKSISFTATVQPSAKDLTFGFFIRPTKAKILNPVAA